MGGPGLRWFTALLFLCAAGSCSQQNQQPEPQQHRSELLQRVSVIGASASAGLGAQLVWTDSRTTHVTSVSMTDVIDATILCEHAPVRSHADTFFYTDPDEFGERFVAAAIQDNPTLVIGVDFLFWYAYGPVRVTGGDTTELAVRMNRLERGFALAEQIDCPLVLGDLPDMHGAATWMLPPGLIPSEKVLTALNERVRQWATAQGNVILIPMAKLQGDINTGVEIRIGDNVWPAEEAGRLMLIDKLHPSAEGLVALGQLAIEGLLESSLDVSATDFRLSSKEVLATIRQRTEDAQKPAEPATTEAPIKPGS
ncbi:MAG: hypothetical protein KAS72_06165 [Phycisphaerales bacterium]|nr:hypothetical protein [Phycisphaerales bacterium]